MMKKPIIVKQVSNGKFRLGLEKQGLSMFENSGTTFEIPYINKKWQHGLQTEEEIKKVEEHYGLQFDNPDHMEEWGGKVFSMNHTINALDPENNPEDLLKLSLCRDIGLAAGSLDEANNAMADYRMVIMNEGDEEEMKASYLERLDTAITDLREMKAAKSPKHLLAIAKYVLPPSTGIGNDSNRAYVKLRSFVEGEMSNSRDEALIKWNTVLELDKALLYVTIDFREAYRMNIVRKNSKGFFYNPMSHTEYGKTEEEAIKYLMNPKNQEEMGSGGKSDTAYSIRQQLKNR